MPSHSPHGKSFYFLQFSPCMWKVVVEKDSKCVEFFYELRPPGSHCSPSGQESKKISTFMTLSLLLGGRKKIVDTGDFRHILNVAVAKKDSCDKGSKTKASSHTEQNFRIGCGPK